MHKTCSRSNQTNYYQEEENKLKFPQVVKEIFVIFDYSKRESQVSPEAVAPRRSTMLQFKAIQPRIFGQHTMILITFYC